MTVTVEKKLRGFAAIKAKGGLEKIKKWGRMGGIAAHEQGTAHEFTSEEAIEAGKKGGNATKKKRGEILTWAKALASDVANIND